MAESLGSLRSVSTRVEELSADPFEVFFTGKVDAIRAKTESATSPSITVQEVRPLDLFQKVTSDEIYCMIRNAPNKHCALDPAPTWVIKQLADVLAPVIANMDHTSFNQEHFPKSQKHAIVSPRIKKPSLDSTDLKSYRPVSNIKFISKLIERSIGFQCIPVYSSSYRRDNRRIDGFTQMRKRSSSYTMRLSVSRIQIR